MRRFFAIQSLFAILASTMLQSNVVRIKPAAGGCGGNTPPWSLTSATETGGGSVSTGGSTNFGATTTAGTTIIFAYGDAVGSVNEQITSITTTGGTCGSTPSLVARKGVAPDSEIWIAGNCPAGITAWVTNFTGGGSLFRAAYVINGLPCTPVADGTPGTVSGTSTSTFTGGSVTTTKSGSFIIAVNAVAHTTTGVSAGWTINAATGVSAYITSTSAAAGTYTPTWTVNTAGIYTAATAAYATH